MDVIQEIGALGFGGIYSSPDYGGCGLGRLESSLVMEALATGCVATSAFISIENMNCYLMDHFASEDLKK